MTPNPQPFQHTYDAHGCAPLAEVTNGCCNPANAGPTFHEGQCCYRFAVAGCCGRPLRVGERSRVASLRRGVSWEA